MKIQHIDAETFQQPRLKYKNQRGGDLMSGPGGQERLATIERVFLKVKLQV